MNVRQLIAELKGLPGDRLVVMASDAEGNSFSPLDEVEVGNYVAENRYSGTLEDDGNGVRCIVLWPTN